MALRRAGRQWAHRWIEEANTDHKHLTVRPTAEGPATHAIGTNLSLMSQLVFDWLEEIFDDRASDALDRERMVTT